MRRIVLASILGAGLLAGGFSGARADHEPGSGAGKLHFSDSSFHAKPKDGSALITVERDDGATGAVTVDYAASSGTAQAGVDFTPTSGTLSWANGEKAPKTFKVALLVNPKPSSSSFTVLLKLSNPTGGAALGEGSSAELTIGTGGGDDGEPGPAGRLGFDEDDFVSCISAGKAVITVERSGGHTGAVSVDYSTSPGTAHPGVDYTPVSGTLKWAAGDQNRQTFTVPLLAGGAEGSVKLVLANPTGGATIDPEHATAVLEISHCGHGEPPPPDHGSAGVLKFEDNHFEAVQGGDPVTIVVERTDGVAGAVSVAYATSDGSAVAGTDYTAASGVLSWADGDGHPKTFQVKVLDNPASSGNKTVKLTLSKPTGGAVLSKEGSAASLVILSKHGDTSACHEDDTTLCLMNGRFRAQVVWRAGDGTSGLGHAVRLTDTAGTVWFFNGGNVEMLIKMVDACALSRNFWVFYAATTNVGFSVEVTDTRTGLVKEYHSAFGPVALPVADTNSFKTCP